MNKKLEIESFNSLLNLKESKIGIRGIPNIGNTCFMNSIIQCLLSSPYFSDFLLMKGHKEIIG